MDIENVCPSDAPVELSDGTILQPDDTIRLRDICELVPLIIETLMAKAGNGQAGRVTPGQTVPVRGNPSAFGPALSPPGFGAKPGSIAGGGLFGPTAGPTGGGGGGGFGGGGGGRRGGPGPPGVQGPPGPAGPGTIEEPLVKMDGNFTVASASPFVPVPDTSRTFIQVANGYAVVLIQAVFGGNGGGGVTNGQIGLRVDGVDFPLTANLLHTFAAGVSQFLACVHASIPLKLIAGSHTVEVIVRGDSALVSPTGLPVTVQANPTVPLYMSIIHG